MRRAVLPRRPIVHALAFALAFALALGAPGAWWPAAASASGWPPPVAQPRATERSGGVRVEADALVADALVADAIVADSLVDFRLSDQFGRVHAAAEYQGRALLLVGAGRGGRAVGTAWVETLRALQDDAAGAGRVPVVAVADLRGVPRLLRRFARGQFPRDRRQPVLLDWDGALARRLAFDREQCTILVVGPAGQIHLRSTIGAVDTATALALLRQAAELTPAELSGSPVLPSRTGP